VKSAIVDCALYEGGHRRSGPVALETALKKADEHPDGFVWIGLHEPSPEVVTAVAEHFNLHPLAVEDAVHAHQRPKLDVYGDSLFLVLKTARYVDSEELVHIGEVMVFMGAKFVVTVRHGSASPLHDVRLDLEAHPDLLGIGPSSVLYAVVDRVVDGYETVIEGFAVDVDEIEVEVFSGQNTNPAERIYRLKREVLEFKRAASPLVDPVVRLADGGAGLPVDPRVEDYFRDALDHLERDVERIQGFDELLTGVLQANFSQLTMRDNQDMRKISAWVAIAAVPTMIFGLYGMNFEHMPELKTEWGYPAVLLATLSICGYMYRRLKRAGWL
jgi:magnesium transporter